ncbi:uncharacterized protein LOC126194694 [Schistocerca nitens]|uniref:uncharacterized protein LOC126194694 n=1 Tax=Schistocerca nitens TaxID=7011 RepID=UPI0021187664|nr:uncharacterized protein LOC126194694 [Schistocerca nitens]
MPKLSEGSQTPKSDKLKPCGEAETDAVPPASGSRETSATRRHWRMLRRISRLRGRHPNTPSLLRRAGHRPQRSLARHVPDDAMQQLLRAARSVRHCRHSTEHY